MGSVGHLPDVPRIQGRFCYNTLSNLFSVAVSIGRTAVIFSWSSTLHWVGCPVFHVLALLSTCGVDLSYMSHPCEAL